MQTSPVDPPLLDLKHLRLLDALYATRSVTRAAEQIGQCQPTVSIWLARLRKDLGDPLFIRTVAGMQPTPRAEALIVTVRAALEALRQLSRPAPRFEPARSTRHFRIAMTDASHVTLLPQLLAHVRALAPSITLEATRIDAHTAEALASGAADLAIGHVPWLESGCYQQALFPQDWVCLVNARHPRIGASLDRRQYKAEGHIGIVSGTGAQLLAQALARQRIARRIVLQLPGFLGLAAVVSSTDLLATLPRQIGETLARLGGLRVLPCPLPIPGFSVKQHWHARFHHEAGNVWLRAVCAQLLLRPPGDPAPGAPSPVQSLAPDAAPQPASQRPPEPRAAPGSARTASKPRPVARAGLAPKASPRSAAAPAATSRARRGHAAAPR